ncbi:hypothetical protein J6590_019862 [Homalodisca vitripennis]|nr:hypothetical protein J6590_019862 [Homalodisca vitripennis]
MILLPSTAEISFSTKKLVTNFSRNYMGPYSLSTLEKYLDPLPQVFQGTFLNHVQLHTGSDFITGRSSIISGSTRNRRCGCGSAQLIVMAGTCHSHRHLVRAGRSPLLSSSPVTAIGFLYRLLDL